MSSLYKQLRQGKIDPLLLRPDLPDAPTQQRIRAGLVSETIPPNCILVNIQDVYNDIDMGAGLPWRSAFSELKALTPPYRSMWAEHIGGGERVGVQVIRSVFPVLDLEIPQGGLLAFRNLTPPVDIVDRVKYVVALAPWMDYGGLANVSGIVHLFLDVLGDCLCAHLYPFFDIPQDAEKEVGDPGRVLFQLVVPAAHALARMNCKNVELRAQAAPGYRQNKRPKTPASVWREIKITSVPKLKSDGLAVNAGDKEERRAHWIRGHYADYRKGAGLFGNPNLKGIFWIPEHQVGNAELGQVVPGYKVS